MSDLSQRGDLASLLSCPAPGRPLHSEGEAADPLCDAYPPNFLELRTCKVRILGILGSSHIGSSRKFGEVIKSRPTGPGALCCGRRCAAVTRVRWPSSPMR